MDKGETPNAYPSSPVFLGPDLHSSGGMPEGPWRVPVLGTSLSGPPEEPF